MAEFDEFELIPDDELELDPQEELDTALREFDDDLEDPEELEVPRIPMGKSWMFDVAQKRFVMHGSSPAETHGLNTLKAWIYLALNVARAAHPIYSDEYGMDDPYRLVAWPDEGEYRAAYQQDVINTLRQHDRILEVGDFQYELADDALYITFTVLTDEEENLEITIPAQGS